MTEESRVCICGPVRNCGPYLQRVFSNMERIGSLFASGYSIVLFYDTSTDDTLNQCLEFQKRNPHVELIVNPQKHLYRFRTHRLAYARNQMLRSVREKEKDKGSELFIMMDCDEVNAKSLDLTVLKKYLSQEYRDKWDALSFQTSPSYYDIWALSIPPYCFSYNHFRYSVQQYSVIQSFVNDRLSRLPPGGLLPCLSAFNGFAVYRTAAFAGCSYDGRLRVDLVPPGELRMHAAAARSPLVFKDYGHVKGATEDCEHRAFHREAIRRNGSRIRIAADILFR